MDFDKMEFQSKGTDKVNITGGDVNLNKKDDHSLSNLLDLTDDRENKKTEKKEFNKSESSDDEDFGIIHKAEIASNKNIEVNQRDESGKNVPFGLISSAPKDSMFLEYKPGHGLFDPSGSVNPGFTDSDKYFRKEMKSQLDNLKNKGVNELSKQQTDLKDTATEILGSISTKINQTKDFMAAERGNIPLIPEKIQPSKPIEQKPPSAPGYFETFDPDSYNSSPVKQLIKEDNEKFISSEDLLGDFKEERPKTTETVLRPQQIIEKPIPSAPIKDIPEPVKRIKPIVIENKPKDEKPEIVQSTKPSKVEEVKVPSVPKPEIKKVEKEQKMISAEEMFYKYGLVESLIYWRDVKKSGIVFGAGLITLLAISCFSVISVFAYLSLLTLAGTIAFRIYKNVLGAVQKTSEGHPFKEYLELDIALSQDKIQQIASVAVAHFNGCVTELRRLFLVEDLVDSLKFGVILWVLTYIGAWFNGMTLVILAFVALFTLPKVYENNKQSIDTYLDLVRSKFLEITDKVKSAIPIGKKPETDKDK